jgi:signal transduction histidine kinase
MQGDKEMRAARKDAAAGRAVGSHREKEGTQRSFAERLTLVLDSINELSKIGSFDELCRRLVELALERLGFDRVGLCFLSADQSTILGAYGTDEDGRLRDERHLRREVEQARAVKKLLAEPASVLFFENEVLVNDRLEQVGTGHHAVARLWDGERIMGVIAVDNLIKQEPITEGDLRILDLYGTATGHLFRLKQAGEALRISEQTERDFRERLFSLVEVGTELSRADSLDSLCRRAVELGRERLGFDRLGIWFRGPDPGTMTGSFGTDEQGGLRDERSVCRKSTPRQEEVLAQKHPAIVRHDEVVLNDANGQAVGQGMHAMAAMWDGERTIGLVASDNLIHRRPITDHDCELLNLYASTLGYLCSRKKAEEALKQYSVRLEDMVEEQTCELREALERAQVADRLKSEFVANVNHELRTPLTNLLLYYQILRSNPGVKAEQRLDVIGRELQRLRSIIEELLNVSRLDQGQVAFFPRLHDLNEIVRTLVDDRRALAEERGLILLADLHPGLPRAWLDEQLTLQAVSNLLTNALNYTPAGGEVRVRTLAGEGDSASQWIGLRVEDTGPGISAEDLPHLFERFYRGRAGHDSRTPGTGLGLAIVKQVVERHGGRIEVGGGAEGRGSVFTCWLPVEQTGTAD